MKRLKFLPLWALALTMGFVGCKDDSDNSVNVDNVVEDGLYVIGDATGYASPDVSVKIAPAPNEADDNKSRVGLYEGYVYLEANKNFTITENVTGQPTTTYGGTLTTVAGGVADQPAEGYLAGSFTKDGAGYQVTTTGLYHIVVDKQLSKAVVVPVSYWSIIGDAVGGWNDNQKLEVKTGNTKDKVEFEKTGVEFGSGSYKFRHTGGWKVPVSDGVNANTNFGGAVAKLVAGGSDIAATDAQKNKIYTVNITWEAKTGFKATLTQTGEIAVNAAGPATFTVTIPDGIDPAATVWVVGNFGADWTGFAMTNTSGNEYTLTKDVPADFTYKYAVSMSTTFNADAWWNYEENHANRRMPVSLTATNEVESWRGEPWAIDYTTLKLQLIGAAIDGSNVGAVEGNDWNWGFTLDAPNEGSPTVNGKLYTWTWDNVSLLADGFKIRAIPETGDISAELGGGNLAEDIIAEITDDSGNIKPTVAGSYNIVVTFNLEDDSRKVSITKN